MLALMVSTDMLSVVHKYGDYGFQVVIVKNLWFTYVFCNSVLDMLF